MTPSFYYPVKPHKLNQEWGRYDPKTYSQFGFTRHNGQDVNLINGQPISAPFAGTCVRTGNQPSGGGIFLGVMSEEFEFKDGKYRVLADFLHCKELLITEGTKVKVGDIIALGDNTGFSTGPHTHVQWRRASFWNGWTGDKLTWVNPDKNEANNSFDPEPYFNGEYAVDFAKVRNEAVQAISLAQRIILQVKKFLKL